MSIQHKNLAEIWLHLEGRHDVANIVREIIGQHSVQSTLQDSDSTDIEGTVQTIIWLKTIFDLQRCYLSGNATGLAECPPYVLCGLLPSELIFSTIIYLISIKKRSFSSQTTLMTREFTRPRHILAQTILSGLRLLLLRKENLTAKDKRRLLDAINSAWRDDRLLGVERFVVSELFAEILNSLNETSRDNPYHREWLSANLPTYAAGLYPLDMRHENFVTPLIHGTMEEDWIDAYWVLFDCLWAVECAVTQRYVDLRRQPGVLASDQIGADTDEIMEQLSQARTSLIISIFCVKGPMEPTPALLDSLAITLLDWNEDLDSFLSRQSSLFQPRPSTRAAPSRNQSYSRNLSEMTPYVETALASFSEWLSSRNSGYEQFNPRKTGFTSNDMQEIVKDWMVKMTALRGETLSKELEGSNLPVYIVDCPKLHVIPKKWLELKLRWSDKWAYESVQANSPIVNWKEGIQCPSCTPGGKIKYARLIEPFQHLSAALDNPSVNEYGLTHYSIGDSSSGSYDATSASLASNSLSDTGSIGVSLHSTSKVNITDFSRPINSEIRTQFASQPPGYTESPVSPLTLDPLSIRCHPLVSPIDHPMSPISDSLNIPIPMSVGSRLSMDLPIPVYTPSSAEGTTRSEPSNTSSGRLYTPSTESMRSTQTFAKSKSASAAVRIANSIRRKPTSKMIEASPLPKEPLFVFSSAGHSLLLWGNGAGHLVRFDIPSSETSSIQGCKYEAVGIQAAAAGNHKCAIVVAGGPTTRRLVIFNGINLSPESEIDLEVSGKLGEPCVAVSRNDKFVAVSLNEQIQLFSLDEGIKALPFHHRIHVHELTGRVSTDGTVPFVRNPSEEIISNDNQKADAGWFGGNTRGLSSEEKAEEQQQQTAIVSRKICFSTDSKRLVVATQLGDHCIYIDVYDCTREPVSTISENPRSFTMPRWTLNDGDLTSVFYDSARRSALVTAFLGKEYPVLIPFPGYDTLQNEIYSTKILHAAQSPSGTNLVAINSMTEIIQFEYTARGTLSPRKLKKAASKISSSVYKPGGIALAMPHENVLQIFWIKDGKCMLRSVKTASGEQFKDYDIRPHFDRLMSLTDRPIIARAPSLMIPELDAT